MDPSADDIPFDALLDPPPARPTSDTTEPPMRHFPCYCGTRLMIAMIPGTQKECLCGAVHEYTPWGIRIRS